MPAKNSLEARTYYSELFDLLTEIGATALDSEMQEVINLVHKRYPKEQPVPALWIKASEHKQAGVFPVRVTSSISNTKTYGTGLFSKKGFEMAVFLNKTTVHKNEMNVTVEVITEVGEWPYTAEEMGKWFDENFNCYSKPEHLPAMTKEKFLEICEITRQQAKQK